MVRSGAAFLENDGSFERECHVGRKHGVEYLLWQLKNENELDNTSYVISAQ